MRRPTVRRPPPEEPRRSPAAITAPILVGAASGFVLLFYFMLFDRPGPLAVAAVLGYWALIACTYLVLGRPGTDWRLPDVGAFVAKAGSACAAACRAELGRARTGSAALGRRTVALARAVGSGLVRARPSARPSAQPSTRTVARPSVRPPDAAHAGGDRREVGAGGS